MLNFCDGFAKPESVQRQLNPARGKPFLSVHFNITLQNGSSSRGLLAKILPLYALFIPSDSHFMTRHKVLCYRLTCCIYEDN